ncbi:ABC transporter ATP-binding protein [Paenibacillus donghaensis]|uniref:Teichoic acid ABC transporter ATP-binding protein n=1 Tax=Paenibacillus donghaensis TaxID=414771 RepID=A0A2Z2KED9_9BACL|nr:ABC transporter ATP-binding protein [Paenibacillus donghaensis]ASA24434.1 teichoic acid ABC transporter ATP-binding protein [Paenibacillus donghaensis]
MEKIIDIRNVTKMYKLYEKPMDRFKESVSFSKRNYHEEFKALDNVTFSINKGDAIGILGTNGSGKSTLLKMITGVLTPTNGDIVVNGKISAILELGAGFNPEYTGRANIYLNGLMMGYNREEMEERINNIIEFADIGSFIEQPVKVYSSGMFARLAFAVSINVEPDILIVDEALAVGDIRFQTKCIEKMKELKAQGTTILFVSHAPEQVKRFCNKAAWLNQGILKALGESSEIVDLYEDFMKNGPDSGSEVRTISISSEELNDFQLPTNPDVLALVTKVAINKDSFKTFEKLEIRIDYEVYANSIEDLLLGVAIYTPKREYIFGPNTHLEKVSIPTDIGRHSINYVISELPLLGGSFSVDVGIFNNEGLVCLDYKQDILGFSVSNKYFSEGIVYMKHRWEVVK